MLPCVWHSTDRSGHSPEWGHSEYEYLEQLLEQGNEAHLRCNVTVLALRVTKVILVWLGVD